MEEKTKSKVGMKEVLRFYWPYIKMEWLLIAVAIVGLIIATVLEIIAPLYVARIVDTIVEVGVPRPQVYEELTGILKSFALVLAIGWIVRRIAQFADLTAVSQIFKEMGIRAFAYTIGHSHAYFADTFSGTLTRRVNRLMQSFGTLADNVLYNLVPLVTSVGIVAVILGRSSIVLALFVLVWVGLYAIVFYFVYKKTWPMFVETAAQDSNATGMLSDAFTNSLAVRLFAAGRRERMLMTETYEKLRRAHKRAWTVHEIIFSLQGLLIILFKVGMLAGSVVLWYQGQLGVGTLVLAQVYSFLLIDQIWAIGRMFRQMTTATSEAAEGVEMLEAPHEISDRRNPEKFAPKSNDVVFDKVTFAYNKTRTILEDFSLHFGEGEKVALVGPSGAGKSTITSLIVRLADVTSGKVMVGGYDVRNIPQDDVRRHIAVVPQESVLFHRSLRENILYGNPDATEEALVEASKKAHCHEFISSLSEGYETLVGERGVKLSGGERQRVAIARAILKDAPILVLDEATSSLDSESEHLIQDALGVLMEGRTTVVIAHRLSTVMCMDRIVVMKDGVITEQGTHDELLKKDGIYAELWNHQVGGFISD